jgi:dolichol-phosphate mannosyltransferase
MSDSIVIIPTYNEKDNIERMVHKVLSLPFPFDLLIIDDSSPDGTGQIVQNLQQYYPDRLFLLTRSGKMGLGTAYIEGFKWALQRNYEYIFEMDADFSHNPEDLLRLYNACAIDGADMAIGSRYKTGVNVVNWPIGRVIMSYFASLYVRFITGIDIQDTTAGFICYRRRLLENFDFDEIHFKGYAFQIEMKYTAWKMKARIIEIPIIFTDRKQGQSKMTGGIFNEAFFGVLKMRIRSFFKKYPQLN